MFNNAIQEFKRSPISVATATIGSLSGCLALVLAWLQFNSQAVIVNGTAVSKIDSSLALDFNLGNSLLVLSFFISSSFTAAIIIRIISRKHHITAIFTSIPIASLLNFLTMLMIFLAPPRTLSRELFTEANDLALYASATILIAVCGQAFLVSLATPSETDKENKSENKKEKELDGIGILIAAGLFLWIWSWLVFSGQVRLSDVFLPEIAHPIEKVSKQNKTSTTIE